ncbi:hypothetical protein LCGC14_2717490, partial [marine sediment metagenome]
MTILENEFDYIEENHSKSKEDEEEDKLTQELDLRNSTIKIKRQKTSLDISITKEDITSIKGVGGRVAEKLKGANFTTIDGIVSTTVERLSKINGIGPATAEKIIEGAKTITERKNLQDFTPNKVKIINKKVAEEEYVVSTEDLEKSEPWFDPKFKIKRQGHRISPERVRTNGTSSQEMVKVKVPEKKIPIHKSSIEAEINNGYELEDLEVEEELIENEINYFPIQSDPKPISKEESIFEVAVKSEPPNKLA